jgi:hypothetical protein
MHAVLWVAVLLVVELVVGLVLLGTWIAEGRRRADDIDRLSRIAERLEQHGGASAFEQPRSAEARRGPGA